MENGEWRMENWANTRAAPATHTSRVETIPLGCRLLLVASTWAVLVVGVTLVGNAFSILHSPFSILFYAAFLQNAGGLSGKIPRALPWAGMRCPFGANGSHPPDSGMLRVESCLIWRSGKF
jgi:hypothetical protein